MVYNIFCVYLWVCLFCRPWQNSDGEVQQAETECYEEEQRSSFEAQSILALEERKSALLRAMGGAKQGYHGNHTVTMEIMLKQGGGAKGEEEERGGGEVRGRRRRGEGAEKER